MKYATQSLFLYHFFILALFVLPNQLYAQIISGFVEDAQTGERLPATHIYFQNGQGVSANNYGFFSLKVPKGEQQLFFSYLGYERYMLSVTGTRDTFLIVGLQTNNQLDEITVTSNRALQEVQAPQMGHISLPVLQMKQIPALYGEADVIKALQLLPGVQSVIDGFAAPVVRGGGPDQNMIQLDGVPVYHSSHLYGLYSIINENAVHSVDFYKGSAPARYGGRLSSVIDIQLREGNRERIRGEIALSSIGLKATLDGPIDKKTTFCVSVRRTLYDVFANLYTGAKFNETAGYMFGDVSAKINRRINDKNRIYLSFYAGKDLEEEKYWDKNFVENDISYTEAGEDSYRWGSTTLSFRWNRVINQHFFSNLTVYGSNFLLGQYSSTSTTRLSDNKTLSGITDYGSGIFDLGATYQVDGYLNEKHHLRTGVSLVRHRFNPGITSIQSASIQTDSVITGTLGHEYRLVNDLSAYVEDEWELNQFFSVNGGLRFSVINTQTKIVALPEPRLTLAFRPLTRWSVKANYARNSQYFHLLRTSKLQRPTDLWLPASERLQVETSHQVSLGTNLLLRHDIEASVEGFYKTMDNLVEYKEGATLLAKGSVIEDKVLSGKGTSYGIEFFLHKKEGRTNGWIAYTLSKSVRQFDSINYGNTFYSSWDRRHDLSINIIQQLSKHWSASASWVYQSGGRATLPLKYVRYPARISSNEGFDLTSLGYFYLFDARNNYRMPATHHLDVNVDFKWIAKRKKDIRYTLSASVYNLYNRENICYVGYSGRSFVKASLLPIMPGASFKVNF